MSDPKHKERRKKVTAYLRALAKGKEYYARADALLAELLPELGPGGSVALPNGKRAVLVDNFADKNKAWKPCGINRFDIKVVADDGSPKGSA